MPMTVANGIASFQTVQNKHKEVPCDVTIPARPYLYYCFKCGEPVPGIKGHRPTCPDCGQDAVDPAPPGLKTGCECVTAGLPFTIKLY